MKRKDEFNIEDNPVITTRKTMKTEWYLFLEKHTEFFSQEAVKNILEKNKEIGEAYRKTEHLINEIGVLLVQLDDSDPKSLSPNAMGTMDIASSKLKEYVTINMRMSPDLDHLGAIKKWIADHNFCLEYIVFKPMQNLLGILPPPPQNAVKLPENETSLPQIQVTEDYDLPPGALPRIVGNFQYTSVEDKITTTGLYPQLEPRGPRGNIFKSKLRKELWDIVFKNLCNLRELRGTEYISLSRQNIKEVEAFLATLEKISLPNDIPENRYFFHIRDVIPNELEPYLCSYILIGELLNYITLNGEVQPILMNNMNQFFIDLIQLNPEGFSNFCLPHEQINTLILLNEGQPPEEKNDEFIQKKAAVFFLIKMIQKQCDTNQIADLWRARTHAEEAGWLLIDEVEQEISMGTLTERVANGLGIGYLLSLNIPPEILQTVGISAEQLRLAGVDGAYLSSYKESQISQSPLQQPGHSEKTYKEGDKENQSLPPYVFKRLEQLKDLIGADYITLPAKEISDITKLLNKFWDNNCGGEENFALLPLVSKINEKYNAVNIATVWVARTHAEEKNGVSKEEVYEHLYKDTLFKLVLIDGLGIGYLLTLMPLEEFLSVCSLAGIPKDILMFAGISDDSAMNQFVASQLFDQKREEKLEKSSDYSPPLFLPEMRARTPEVVKPKSENSVTEIEVKKVGTENSVSVEIEQKTNTENSAGLK